MMKTLGINIQDRHGCPLLKKGQGPIPVRNATTVKIAGSRRTAHFEPSCRLFSFSCFKPVIQS